MTAPLADRTLADRTVVVAGAGGIGGRAVCAALTAAGAHVVAVGSRAESLADVDAAETAVVDLADPVAVAAWAAELRDRRSSIDGLLHLVGGWRGGSAPDDFDWLERRVLTTLRVASRELRDDLGASSAGRLAIVSSASVAQPKWGMANYVTLKSAAETWVQALASGWRAKGTPTAAVTFVVGALDELGAVDDLAAACAALWSVDHEQLNGALVELTPAS
ncbi:SDR family NAD(P)-dependent oxidoreductase [Microcella humidisoli]|uniref:SDR family NAD(P)-dependent oxidoreductase n=1 Tax=Microcella humidisoli TaxID=2963406 RepID=A0ABY5FYM2_9MICO|nr:SDR family NAD(P)-dependent oxidoreductase [Microcella humidisoli]UTT63415.1 SDR family NAD(P)-dependent oxidoreductase [Microcella humidisoli]